MKAIVKTVISIVILFVISLEIIAQETKWIFRIILTPLNPVVEA